MGLVVAAVGACIPCLEIRYLWVARPSCQSAKAKTPTQDGRAPCGLRPPRRDAAGGAATKNHKKSTFLTKSAKIGAAGAAVDAERSGDAELRRESNFVQITACCSFW
jgi:hypothetical protein